MDNKKQQPKPAESPAKKTQTSDKKPTNEALASSAKPSHSKTKTTTSRGGIVNFIFIILLLLLVLAGGFYFYQQLTAEKQKTVNLTNLTKVIQQRLDTPLPQIKSLNQQQRALDDRLSGKLTQITATTSQLQQQINDLSHNNPDRWIAAEVNYLVTLAERKLWLEKDSQSAVSLLKEADERLNMINDPALNPLRKALAQDIAAVDAIEVIDVDGTIFTIDSIIDNLDKFKLKRIEPKNVATTDGSLKMTDSPADWRANLAKSWQTLLKRFVVIRKRTTDPMPLLTPKKQRYLIENIRNKLLQSQLALFRHDEANYHHSIRFAKKWLSQYFDLSDGQTKQALQQLDALMALKIPSSTIKQFAVTPLLKQWMAHGSLPTEPENPL